MGLEGGVILCPFNTPPFSYRGVGKCLAQLYQQTRVPSDYKRLQFKKRAGGRQNFKFDTSARPAHPLKAEIFSRLTLLLSQDQKNNRDLTSPSPLKIRASDRATMAASALFYSES